MFLAKGSGGVYTDNLDSDLNSWNRSSFRSQRAHLQPRSVQRLPSFYCFWQICFSFWGLLEILLLIVSRSSRYTKSLILFSDKDTLCHYERRLVELIQSQRRGNSSLRRSSKIQEGQRSLTRWSRSSPPQIPDHRFDPCSCWVTRLRVD